MREDVLLHVALEERADAKLLWGGWRGELPLCCLTFVLKPRSQMLHLKGLSLVCDRMWISRAELQANVLKQIWHVVLPRAGWNKERLAKSWERLKQAITFVA